MRIPAPTEEPPAAAWLVHHRFGIALVALVCCIPFDVVTGPATAVLRMVGLALLLLHLFADFLATAHFEPLCERCMSRIPDDAAVQVQRRRRELRWHHRLDASLLLRTGIVMSLAASDYVLREADVTGLVFYVVWAFLLYTDRLALFHSRVIPWCPYCPHHGDGHTHVPTPDPTTAKRA